MSAGERRAWGWVAHLREGGTTPWHEWTAAGEARGRLLPGAQQLELLRRLNLLGAPGPALAARVLAASAPGRGRPDLELAGAVEPGPFGPRPIDPADLPAEELVRVAIGVLAEDLAAPADDQADDPADDPAASAAWTRRGLPRPWRRRYRLVGDPWLADPVREALVARGRPPGGPGATVLVLATDLATMLTDAWRHRVLTEGGPSWSGWLEGVVHHDRVPPRADVAQAARTWSGRVGRDRVHLVLDRDALPRLTGTRTPLPGPRAVSADAAEVGRRVAGVLGLLVLPPRRAELLRQHLLPRLAALGEAGGPPLVVPPGLAEWTRRQAARMRDEVRAAGYPVHGDLDALLPVAREGVPGPTDDGVLRVALHLLLAGDGPGAGPDHRPGEDGLDQRGTLSR